MILDYKDVEINIFNLNLVLKKIKQNYQYIAFNGNDSSLFVSTLLWTLNSGKTFILGKTKNIKNEKILFVNEGILNNASIEENTLVFDDVINNIKKNNSDNFSIILNTSGTTSIPKSVVYTYASLNEKISELIKTFNISSTTRELVCLPKESSAVLFGHILPVVFEKGFLEILDMPFNPLNVSKFLMKKFDYTGLTPTMLNILNQLNVNWNNIQIKNILIGGEPADFALIDKLNSSQKEKFIFATYGLSETGGIITNPMLNHSKKSVGKIINGIEYKIVDSELYLKGSSLFFGYIIDGKMINRDLWFKTGDLVKVDEDGFLYIVGRKKNIIISSGVNIYPEEIQKEINSFPLVVNSFVYGEKDDVLGERVEAIVYVKNINDVDLMQIKKYLSRRLEVFKVPKNIRITTDFKIIGLGKAKYDG